MKTSWKYHVSIQLDNCKKNKRKKMTFRRHLVAIIKINAD